MKPGGNIARTQTDVSSKWIDSEFEEQNMVWYDILIMEPIEGDFLISMISILDVDFFSRMMHSRAYQYGAY